MIKMSEGDNQKPGSTLKSKSYSERLKEIQVLNFEKRLRGNLFLVFKIFRMVYTSSQGVKLQVIKVVAMPSSLNQPKL